MPSGLQHALFDQPDELLTADAPGDFGRQQNAHARIAVFRTGREQERRADGFRDVIPTAAHWRFRSDGFSGN